MHIDQYQVIPGAVTPTGFNHNNPRFIRLGKPSGVPVGTRYALVLESVTIGTSTGGQGAIIGLYAPPGGGMTILGPAYLLDPFLDGPPIAACAVRDTEQLLVATCSMGTLAGGAASILLLDFSGPTISLVNRSSYWSQLVTDHGSITGYDYGAQTGAMVSFDSTNAALFVNPVGFGSGGYAGYPYCRGYIPLVSGVPQPEILNRSTGGWATTVSTAGAYLGGPMPVVYDAWALSPNHVLVMLSRRVDAVPSPTFDAYFEIWYQPSVVLGYPDALEQTIRLPDEAQNSRGGTPLGPPGYFRLAPAPGGFAAPPSPLDGDLYLIGNLPWSFGFGTVTEAAQWCMALGPAWYGSATHFSFTSFFPGPLSHPLPVDDMVGAHLNDLAPGVFGAFAVTQDRPFVVNLLGRDWDGTTPETPAYVDPSWYVRGDIDTGVISGPLDTSTGDVTQGFRDVIAMPDSNCLVSTGSSVIFQLAFDIPNVTGPTPGGTGFIAPYDGYFVPEPTHYGSPVMGEYGTTYNQGYYSAVVTPRTSAPGTDPVTGGPFPATEWWYYRPPGYLLSSGATENIQAGDPPVFRAGTAVRFGIGYFLDDRTHAYFPGDLAVQQLSPSISGPFPVTAYLIDNWHSTNFGASAWGRVYTKILPPGPHGEPRFQQQFSPCRDNFESMYVYGPFAPITSSPPSVAPLPMIWTFVRFVPPPPPPPPPPPSPARGTLAMGSRNIVVRQPFASRPTGSKSVTLRPR
jgi:hypothetical protein